MRQYTGYLLVAAVCMLCIAGCRKEDDAVKVEVQNSTSETVKDIKIVLQAGSESFSREIPSLEPGKSVSLEFPAISGEGSFDVSGRLEGRTPYSANVGYVEATSGKSLILLCPKPTPAGFGADCRTMTDSNFSYG